MNELAMTPSAEAPVETILRDELAHGDIVLGTIGPVLGHLLANDDHSLFSDEIVSRVRGMAGDLAHQMLTAQAEAADAIDPRSVAERGRMPLTQALLANPRLVAHCHALALEWQLTNRLESRNAIDPVLSPLLQALIASDDAATASTAMAALASQARFAQRQRRMELPLAELPADHFHVALATWIEQVDAADAEPALRAANGLREGYDESAGRLGLLARLVHAMGAGALAALSVSHAGAAMFLSALATATNQDRDLTIIATNDRQLARLALSLRAAGLKPQAIEEQFLYIHPDVALPEGFDALRADRAQALLGASSRISAA
jgi:hypothetical protein